MFAEHYQQLPLPVVDTNVGSVKGWRILVPAGEVDDPQAFKPDEIAGIQTRCISACEAHWASTDAVSVNCDDPDAFEAPVHLENGLPGPYDLISDAQLTGAGIFAGQSLTCELDSSCCHTFDEDLCAATPARTTPANEPLGRGEEYRMKLDPFHSSIKITTNLGSYTTKMHGSIGYSFCRDDGVVAPCPFYLGSLTADANSNLSPVMKCADNSIAVVKLSDLELNLSQPAFGIADASGQSTKKGFPAGALLFEAGFKVWGQPLSTRQASQENVVVSASTTQFKATDISFVQSVPCNGSTASITVKVTAQSKPSDAVGRPPLVKNTTSTSGACGAIRALLASVQDPDGDAGPVRWRVNGVLMSPGTNAIVVDGPYTVEAVVRDSRGATTTARKLVSCQ